RFEMQPQWGERVGLKEGGWATVESRRGQVKLQAQVVTTIRPDTIFIPYHWAGAKSVNQLTIAAQDPVSKIPEYKVCAVRVTKAEAAPDWANGGGGGENGGSFPHEFFFFPKHRLRCPTFLVGRGAGGHATKAPPIQPPHHDAPPSLRHPTDGP